MKNCQYCGTPLQDNAVYCYNCSSPCQAIRPARKSGRGLTAVVIVLAIAAAASVTFMLTRILGGTETTAADFGLISDVPYNTAVQTGDLTGDIPFQDESGVADTGDQAPETVTGQDGGLQPGDGYVLQPTEPGLDQAGTIKYDTLLVGRTSPGITEQEAYALFGDPITSDPIDYDDETYIEFRYDSFLLRFLYKGDDMMPCSEIEVTGRPCPVYVCGLSVGMTSEEASYSLGSSPFTYVYSTQDDSCWVYEDAENGYGLVIYFSDSGTVADILVSYNP